MTTQERERKLAQRVTRAVEALLRLKNIGFTSEESFVLEDIMGSNVPDLGP